MHLNANGLSNPEIMFMVAMPTCIIDFVIAGTGVDILHLGLSNWHINLPCVCVRFTLFLTCRLHSHSTTKRCYNCRPYMRLAHSVGERGHHYVNQVPLSRYRRARSLQMRDDVTYITFYLTDRDRASLKLCSAVDMKPDQFYCCMQICVSEAQYWAYPTY